MDAVSGATERPCPHRSRVVTHGYEDIYSRSTPDAKIFQSGISPKVAKNPRILSNHTYISSILSKNEVDRDDKYNRKLFRRLKRGHYIINPKLAVWVEGAWRNIYEVLSLDALGYRRQDRRAWYAFDPQEHMQQQLQHFKTLIKQLQDGEEAPVEVYF